MVRPVRVLFLLVVILWTVPIMAAPAETAKKPKDDDYELYKMLVDTIDQVERNYVVKVDRRELVESAIRGVLSKLDPYSSYIGPEDLDRFRTSVESEFGGIGIQIAATMANSRSSARCTTRRRTGRACWPAIASWRSTVNRPTG